MILLNLATALEVTGALALLMTEFLEDLVAEGGARGP
jgi:hypothetical protein